MSLPVAHYIVAYVIYTCNATTELDINLFWGVSCRTSEGNFHLYKLKIHLPTFFSGTHHAHWQDFLFLQLLLA